MRETIITVSSLCMMAALYRLLMTDNRFMAAIRLILGLEITKMMVTLAEKFVQGISGWS